MSSKLNYDDAIIFKISPVLIFHYWDFYSYSDFFQNERVKPDAYYKMWLKNDTKGL